MSGRGAYARKEREKVKAKEGIKVTIRERPESLRHGSSIASGGLPADYLPEKGTTPPRDSRLDDLVYTQSRRPILVANQDMSGIEKSSFREMMDKKSEGVRKGLSSLGKKKSKRDENSEQRPPTPLSSNSQLGLETTDLEGMCFPLPAQPMHAAEKRLSDDSLARSRPRSGPPLGRLPPLPVKPQLKRWSGSGRPPMGWSKLKKDPELWDRRGDTLVYLESDAGLSAKPPASLRVSSQVLESTGSPFFIATLGGGYVGRDRETPPSSPSSSQGKSVRSPRDDEQAEMNLLSSEDASGFGAQTEVAYEIQLSPGVKLGKAETRRYNVTTRNVFAVLYQKSLVGSDLYQSLSDVYERLRIYMPSETDVSGLINDYIIARGLDDVRNEPAIALSLLAWCEDKRVRWYEGWREAFIHCAGMQSLLDAFSEFNAITPITKALLERASLEVQCRVEAVQVRLMHFDLVDMWPPGSPKTSPERLSFERLRRFLARYYEDRFGQWPVPQYERNDHWLTRFLTKEMQKDFNCLYDYFVDRRVTWDCSEERSSKKWIMKHSAKANFEADTVELPMTDILVMFDNNQRFPHIPHPYCLVPESTTLARSKSSVSRSESGQQRSTQSKLAERKAALAYTEATNIYSLGPEFAGNKLVDAFVRFEKEDHAGDVDPYAARRGRWVLIYGVLQVLASISVDIPGMLYKNDVDYYLNPRLRGTPPWRPDDSPGLEASHEGSHCWQIPGRWNGDGPSASDDSQQAPAPEVASAGLRPSQRSRRPPIDNSASSIGEDMPIQHISYSRPTMFQGARMIDTSEMASHGSYGPGIEKVGEPWPVKENWEGGSLASAPKPTLEAESEDEDEDE